MHPAGLATGGARLPNASIVSQAKLPVAMASHRKSGGRSGCFSEPLSPQPAATYPLIPAAPESSTGLDEQHSSDECAITNRCSPKSVYSVVCKFNEFKKQCVREIGFGGILDLPRISKVNLKLSAWLLSKLDVEESALVFSESRRLYVHEKDVGIVFGIPCGDLDVGCTDISSEQIEFIREDCGLTCSRSFKSLEHMLARHIDDKSSRQEVHRFKTAFVIFVMGHLLAPSVKHDHGNTDYWGALKDPELIDRFNWCRYVHYHVLEASQKTRDEVMHKGRVTALSSCHLFLQVLFLDNIELRFLSKNHNDLPRIKVFDQGYLKRMTEACASRGENDFSRFIGLRLRKLSAYMRHTYQSDGPPPVHQTTVPRYTEPPLIPQRNEFGGSSMVSADDYQFHSPTDFGTYAQAKHPSLARHYVLNFFEMHNAQIMREVANLRCALLRRNAKFFDWFVDNVGIQNIQRMHKRPPVGNSTPLSSNSNQSARSSSKGNLDAVRTSSGRPLPTHAASTAAMQTGGGTITRVYSSAKRTNTSNDNEHSNKRLSTGGHMAEGNYNFTSLQPQRDKEPLQEIHYVEDDVHADEEEETTAEQEPLQDIQDVQDDAHVDEEEEEERTAEQEPLQEIERRGQKRNAAARKKPEKEEQRPRKTARIETMTGRFLDLRTKDAKDQAAEIAREKREIREKEAAKGDEYSIKRCISVVNTMELTIEEKAKAIAVITKSKDNREAFICTFELDQECALIWLRNEMA